MAFNPISDGSQSTLGLVIGNNNDVDASQSLSYIIGTVGAGFTVTGLAAPGQARPPLVLINASGQTMTFTNQDALSLAPNRITTSSGVGAAVTVTNKQVATLIYDVTNSTWRIMSVL